MTATGRRAARDRTELGSFARWVALGVLVLAVLLVTIDITVLVAARLPQDQAAQLLAAARDAFTAGLHATTGIGAAVLLATAIAAWFLLRDQKLEESEPGHP